MLMVIVQRDVQIVAASLPIMTRTAGMRVDDRPAVNLACMENSCQVSGNIAAGLIAELRAGKEVFIRANGVRLIENTLPLDTFAAHISEAERRVASNR